MKTNNILTTLALSMAIGMPMSLSAQTLQQQTVQQQTGDQQVMKQKSNIPTAKSVKAQMDRRAHVLANSSLRPLRGTSDAGTGFTDSHLRGITRAGTIGNETGTSGSSENGQIGTTNQGDMARASTQGALLTSHFGSTGSRTKTAKPNNNTRSNTVSKNP